MSATHITSTPTAPWTTRTPVTSTSATELLLTATPGPAWQGFGGCFNEIGWNVLQALQPAAREKILRDLFAPDGCQLTVGRLPVGANDYALEWYSHNETPNDFAMQHFSIARDRQYLLPYIRAAQAVAGNLTLFASPWSPPTWFKQPRAYNFGTMIWQPEYLAAYALYFLRFIQAYRAEGIEIHQLHLQNEPVADQKFPSCLWTGPQMRDFIRDHLGPTFAKHNERCALWLGTLNTPKFDEYVLSTLLDPACRKFIAGIGLQWDSRAIVQRCHDAFPEVPLMQTENECGDGKNTWSYAEYIFELFRHYIANGTRAYVYWNMVLPPGGQSTWGWNQNAMITVDPATRQVTHNPEFYVMKHYSHFIRPGAARLHTTGPWSANATAFNSGGKSVVALNNPTPDAHPVTIRHDSRSATVELPAHSFNTVVLDG